MENVIENLIEWFRMLAIVLTSGFVTFVLCMWIVPGMNRWALFGIAAFVAMLTDDIIEPHA